MRLTRRERGLAVGIAIVTAAWALFAFGVTPAMERLETLKRVIPQKQGELERLRSKAGEYMSLRQSMEDFRTRIASQEQAVELLPFIESIVDQCGLTQNVTTMKQVLARPETDVQEILVEIEIENVALRQICEFLQKIQAQQIQASIKQLHIRKNLTNQGMLDSSIEVRRLKLNADYAQDET